MSIESEIQPTLKLCYFNFPYLSISLAFTQKFVPVLAQVQASCDMHTYGRSALYASRIALEEKEGRKGRENTD